MVENWTVKRMSRSQSRANPSDNGLDYAKSSVDIRFVKTKKYWRTAAIVYSYSSSDQYPLLHTEFIFTDSLLQQKRSTMGCTQL
ncbi:hypothetical protein RRG08_005682 [Elysia crispata]|uniref:Uncharacterized protein n=1 Tax=Elysia crispata TaxID=231223 RepID=A0AAE0YCZ9_9GAST|nr:hypothetical protein RRG08_005682 [Elysia crispata]